MAELYFVETPLTTKAVEKAKKEHQQRLEKELDNNKIAWGNLALKCKSWYKLIGSMNVKKEKAVSFFNNGYKVTIEKV